MSTAEEEVLRMIGEDPEAWARISSSHCSSCHEDVEYGYDMCWVTLPDGRDVEVCCAVKDAWMGAQR